MEQTDEGLAHIYRLDSLYVFYALDVLFSKNHRVSLFGDFLYAFRLLDKSPFE